MEDSTARPTDLEAASRDEVRENAAAALRYIMPLLEKHGLRWCISGGFACLLYGADRPIGNIDIDIESERDSPALQALLVAVEPNTELPFQRWVDDRHDNWMTDVVVGEQLLSICNTPDLKLRNAGSDRINTQLCNSVH